MENGTVTNIQHANGGITSAQHTVTSVSETISVIALERGPKPQFFQAKIYIIFFTTLIFLKILELYFDKGISTGDV